jgi:hypothetical protein
MSDWINISDRPDNGGFNIQLRFETDAESAEIRLLLNGIEVARSAVHECAEQQFIRGLDPERRKERSYDLHDDEIEWVENHLGIRRESRVAIDVENEISDSPRECTDRC